jgi:hypothetical protein
MNAYDDRAYFFSPFVFLYFASYFTIVHILYITGWFFSFTSIPRWVCFANDVSKPPNSNPSYFYVFLLYTISLSNYGF